ncbi:hypothetical protein Q3G72_008008 [Acer saccharum]|nr:hypothetical protein Q3G72_008008 [Acer saccharum]
MSNANIFAQALTQSLYDVELINRKMSVGGAVHTLASRAALQKACDSYSQKPQSLARSALRGAILARTIASPVTICLDMLVGTGRTHFAPCEQAPAAEGESPIAHELKAFKDDFLNHIDRTHCERLDWLKNRLEQSLEHPCDAGFFGVIAGASSLPMLFAVNGVCSMLSASLGCVAYLVQRASGCKNAAFVKSINDVNAWFPSVLVMLIKTMMPTLSLGFSVATTLGELVLGSSSFIPMYLALQSCRLATASLKIGISAVGAGLGVCIGLGVLAVHAAQKQMSPKPDVGDALYAPGLKPKPVTQASLCARALFQMWFGAFENRNNDVKPRAWLSLQQTNDYLAVKFNRQVALARGLRRVWRNEQSQHPKSPDNPSNSLLCPVAKAATACFV